MSATSGGPSIHVDEHEGLMTIRFIGDWDSYESVSGQSNLLERLSPETLNSIELSGDELQSWDSRVPATLHKIIQWADEHEVSYQCKSMPDDITRLLALLHDTKHSRPESVTESETSFFERLGSTVLAQGDAVHRVCEFIGEQVLELNALFRRRSKFRVTEVLIHMYECGPAALPIVTLISLLVGFILAFIAAVQLEKFGAEIYMANLVSLAMFREMGAVMASVILAGRTGAAFAANIGAMKVNEEVDALQAFGVSPQGYLIVPRILALLIMMPLLCVYADVIGVIGGGIVGITLFDFSMQQYIEQARLVTGIGDVIVGVTKATVFGLLIAFAGCYHGIHCERTASAVGSATTRAVVSGIVLIVLFDAVFAVVFHMLGM